MDFGAIVNIAEVSGEAPGGDPADPSDDIVALDDARVGVNQRPSIGLSSTASPSGKVRLGQRIRYVLTVTNTGNVTLSRLALTSGLRSFGRLACSSSPSVGLAPGQVRTCTASYTVSTADAKRGKVVNSTVVKASAPYATSTSYDVTARATTSREVRRTATALKGPAAEPARAALADTGGPAVGIGWLGVALVGAGAIVLARSRRRAI